MAQSLVRLIVLPALAAIAMSPASHAQARDEGGPAVLEEVVVRANCRAQNLQEVPMSVSAFTEDFFRYSGVRTLDSLDAYTPSLRVQTRTDSRSISIRIRGIGSTGINSGINSGIDPSVGVFIDSVYQGRAGMTVSDLVDVERVEVLRGPQGTLIFRPWVVTVESPLPTCPTV